MFAKFLLTVAVVAIIWFGFKYLQRVTELRGRRDAARAPSGDKPRFEPVTDGESVQDLVKCSVCNTFRSPKLGPCGRAKCPY
ncbi:MAG: hypothetical protein H7Y60_10620 [Rhodospirillaceae bacterium]|nr:hypothetical protein [Rhodospirillales bacterium]